jgi:hypothetical protein
VTPHSSDHVLPYADAPCDLRQKALRARWLAIGILDKQVVGTLIAYAEEAEARAAALERALEANPLDEDRGDGNDVE